MLRQLMPFIAGILLSCNCAAGADQVASLPPEISTWLHGYVAKKRTIDGQPPSDPDGQYLRIAYGDLSNHWHRDAGLLFPVEGIRGGTDWIQNVAVFLEGPQGFTYCCSKQVGAKGEVTVESNDIKGNRLVLDGKRFLEGKDAFCCPSRKWTSRLKVVGPSRGHFLEVESTSSPAEPPWFSDYSVAKTFQNSPKPVDFSSDPRARKYRTVLGDAAPRGPNFAGHYTVVTWGCGVACQELAIVDAATGRVHFPKSFKLNAYQLVTDGSDPFQFEKGSKLLVLTGSPNDTDELGIFYYIWTGSDFKRIYAEKKVWPR